MSVELLLILFFFTMGSKVVVFVCFVAWMNRKTMLEEAREREEAWDSGWSYR